MGRKNVSENTLMQMEYFGGVGTERGEKMTLLTHSTGLTECLVHTRCSNGACCTEQNRTE